MKRKKIWVCLVCGKRSNDHFGNNPIDKGWDESCVLNSVQLYEDECVFGENGRVIKIKEKSDE